MKNCKKTFLLVALAISFNLNSNIALAQDNKTKAEATTETVLPQNVARDALASMKTYENKQIPFSFVYPSNWKATEGAPPTFLKLMEPNSVASVGVTIEPTPPGGTSKGYSDVIEKFLSQDDKNYKKLSEEEITVSGIKAIKKLQTMGQGNAKQIGVYAVKSDNSIAVHFTCLNGLYSELEPVFNKMIESIKIGDGKVTMAPAQAGPSVSPKSVAEASLASTKDYKSKDTGFSFAYPSNWEMNEGTPPNIFSLSEPHRVSNVRLSVEPAPQDSTSKMYADACLKYATAEDPDLLKVLTEEEISLGGAKVVKRVFARKGEEVKQIGIYYVKDQKAHALHFACMNDYFKDLEPVFNKMIETTKF